MGPFGAPERKAGQWRPSDQAKEGALPLTLQNIVRGNTSSPIRCVRSRIGDCPCVYR